MKRKFLICVRLLMALGICFMLTRGVNTVVQAAEPQGIEPPSAIAMQSSEGKDVSNNQLRLSTIPDWSAEGGENGSEFGISVASAGDVNGDGFDDVIVGAWKYDIGAVDSGRAYLYYGSSDGLSTAPDRVIEPPSIETYGYFGVVVGTAGDVNGDGFSDIFVTMTNYNGTYSDEGAVFVWYGSEDGLETNYNWFARGNTTYAHMGWDAGTAGDINNDGFDDLIVGAYRYDSASISHAYVWLGSETGLGEIGLPTNADWIASSDQDLSAFGAHVGYAGDVNGDGFSDIFVGAPDYNNGTEKEGMVFVWHGSENFQETPDGTPTNANWKAESNQLNGHLTGRFNSAPQEGGVGFAGDVNGDGFDDFLAGSHLYDHGETDEGAIFLWYGSESGLNEGVDGTPDNADWMVEGNQESGWFGSGAGTSGDVNGDGYDDILIGASYYDSDGLTNQGCAFIWLGSASGFDEDGTPGNADWQVGSGQEYINFGWSVATAGDVNGDGAADVIVGAPSYKVTDISRGGAFVYHGEILGSISGTVTYLGDKGYNPVTVVLFTDPGDAPIKDIIIASLTGEYPYSFSDLPEDTYYLGALMDLNENEHPDPNEPFAWYVDEISGEREPIIISKGNIDYTNIDFDLLDPGTIQGTVTYTGLAGVTGPISVSAHLVMGEEPVTSAEDIQSGETYLIQGLAAGKYYISAFVDLDSSGGPPGENEPLVWYDEDGDGTPDQVNVPPGTTLQDIDIVIAAPTITSESSTTFVIGQEGSFMVETTGQPSPAITLIGDLPDGVSFIDNEDGTGTLSGTPTEGSQGTYVLNITATNGVDPEATQEFTLTVEEGDFTVFLPLIVR